ncbi:MAG: 3-methyl-2-oxobutanoate hydroxymethyltransferase [Verrucomicrobia bacterium]|nr:3-methyl-2-oxobutanoate hydroxymethyltransferase [Verrucomicrobiota bacterium]
MKKAETKWTASRIKAQKGHGKIACLTAYDYSTARIIDETGIEVILVGDSLAMTMLGYETTLPVTMEEMLHHTSAVVRAVRHALVVADMPFMSYQVSTEQAIGNAGRFIKEAGADAVKIEGGAIRVPLAKALVQNGIPVLGHIGLTPQSIRETGGYKVQGRNSEEAQLLLNDAQQLAKAGVFALVLECVPATLGAEITKAVCVPTIGIGAGRHCDGQILVSHDMLGLFTNVAPRFVRKYAELGTAMRKAFAGYKSDVEKGRFPEKKHSY